MATMASHQLDSPILNFSVALYKQLISQGAQCGNVVYSPMSIAAALSMALAGARGKTAAELSAVLQALGGDSLCRHLHGFFCKYASLVDDVKVHSVNQIYCEHSFPVLGSYRSLLWNNYGVEIESVDFRTDCETVRQRINTWIEEVTESNIDGYLYPGSLDTLTTMVIVNAVHIKGFWESQFSPRNTIRCRFRGTMGIKEVQMMNRLGEYKTASCDDLNVRAVEIPYRGGYSSMVVIVPKDSGGLLALEKRLTGPKLAQLLKNLSIPSTVLLYLPKFKLEKSFDFKAALQGIDIKDLFTPEADLSGICETANLFLTDLFHKSILEVNEEGVEDHPAYTMSLLLKNATILNLSCKFVVDQPFIFLVRIVQPNVVLCMGSVRDL